MEHEIIEKLKKSESGIDTKHILNVSNQVVSQDIIDQIESGGITTELLESYPHQIFYYKTQITLHGIFNINQQLRIGGYKNIIQNKNQSLGIKYSAIDILKKKRIIEILRLEKSSWQFELNSQEFYLFKIYTFSEQNLELAKNRFVELPGNFIGNSEMYVAQSMLGKFIVIKMNINAIYEKELYTFISKLLKKEYNHEIYEQVKKEYELAEEKAHEEFLKQYEREKLEREQAFEVAKKEFFENNKVTFIHTFAEGRLLFLSYEFNKLNLNVLHIYKHRGRLMYYIETVQSLENISATRLDHYKRKTLQDIKRKRIAERLTQNFYFKPLNV